MNAQTERDNAALAARTVYTPAGPTTWGEAKSDAIVWAFGPNQYTPYEFATYVIPCSDGCSMGSDFTISQAREFYAALGHALAAHDAN